ncbi:unnamed protein product [Diamesa tonsa]
MQFKSETPKCKAKVQRAIKRMRCFSVDFVETIIITTPTTKNSAANFVSKRETKPACKQFDFTCGNGDCIGEELVCDGKVDCTDITDEDEKLCKSIYCPKFAFQCNYGACVDGSFPCNGVRDCLDGSDELSSRCPTDQEIECPVDTFTCTSGKCIPFSELCDGVYNCDDNSDETDTVCLKSYCPSFGFRCRYGACISKDNRCNNVINCVDGSDEDIVLCREKTTVLPPTTEAPRRNQSIATTTFKPPVGSCVFPDVKNGIIRNAVFLDEYTRGTYIADGDVVEVTCLKGFALIQGTGEDGTLTCAAGRWNNIWPKCQKLCDGLQLFGRTIRSECERNGGTVSCNSTQFPGTQATIKCKSGYQLPDRAVLHTQLTCLEGGDWDYSPFRCVALCGQVTPQAKQYVVGGKTAISIAEVPWHTAIYRESTLICGGTILSERIVLSAAHCFFKEETGTSSTVSLYDKSLFEISVGKYYRNKTASEEFATQFYGISEIITVPGYDGYVGFFSADIALLILSGYIEFRPHIAPICIDRNLDYSEEKVVPDGWIGIVAGWGFTEAAAAPSETLKLTSLPVIDFKVCKQEAPADYKPFVTPDKFCAGYKDAEGSGVCQGDSGGGMVFPKVIGGEKIYFIRGLVSNGRSNAGGCDLGFYTMFTNIQEHISLIKTAERNNPTI